MSGMIPCRILLLALMLMPLLVGCATPTATEPVAQQPAEKPKEEGDFSELVLAGIEAEGKKEYPEAINYYSRALLLDAESPVCYIRRAVCHARLSNNEEAAKDLYAATAISPRTVADFQALSWLRSTAPLPQFRDGSLAVAYAQRSLRGTKAGKPETVEHYDLIAAGYAEMGNFQKAVDTIREGIKFFPDSDRTPAMKERLALYEARKKFREDWSPVNRPPTK